MKHFPIYLNLSDKHVVVSGTGEIAAAKLRLLLKTEARISVFGENPHTDIPNWAGTGRIKHFRRRVEAPDLRDSLLLYCASSDPEEDSRVAHIGRKLGILVNIVDIPPVSEKTPSWQGTSWLLVRILLPNRTSGTLTGRGDLRARGTA